MTRLKTIAQLLLLTSFSALQIAAARENKFIDNRKAAIRAGHSFSIIDSTEPASLLSRNYLLEAEKNIVEVSSYHFFDKKMAVKTALGTSKKGSTIEAFYFPGKSNKRALIIGGVHGSELSAIEVAKELIRQLQEDNTSGYEVIVIPCLFPDNAQAALSNPSLIGSTYNFGRYTENAGVDPNRQMPSLGKPFFPHEAKDHLGRKIENENQLLLNLIASFRPERIVNLHAIRNTEKAGVYADPRTDANGKALGFEPDSLLAIKMAKFIEAGGGDLQGNTLKNRPSARYPNDPQIAPANEWQRRTVCGSSLPGNKGCGVSLGSWATTAVDDNSASFYNRDAITLLTMEFPGYKRSIDYVVKKDREYIKKQVQLFALSIQKIFLNEE